MNEQLPASFELNGLQLNLDFHDPDFVQNPYISYAYLHAHAPLFYWQNMGMWCTSSYEQVNTLLRDRRFGRENKWGPPLHDLNGQEHLQDFYGVERYSLLELEPPCHTQLRKLVNRAFVSRQVERLRPRIERLAHELIDSVEAKGSMELLSDYATPIPLVIITEILGVPNEMGAQFVAWSHAMVEMYVHNPSSDAQQRANDAARDFSAYLRDLIRERRKKPQQDDLLGTLLEANTIEGALSDDEVISSVILLLNAGHEATVHQGGNGVKTLLEHSDNCAAFVQDDAAIAACVEELLRFSAPLHMFTRFAYEDVEIGPDVILQRGDQIGLLLGAANRDPRAFARSNVFDPLRKDQKNVTFGAGVHFCIGAPLARLELQSALKVLFQRLPNLQLSKPPQFADTYHFHGLDALHVQW